MTQNPQPPSDPNQPHHPQQWAPINDGSAVIAPVSHVPSYLMVGGGIVAVLAAFLPWLSASAGDISVSVSGTSGDGKLTLMFGLVAIALGAGAFSRGLPPAVGYGVVACGAFIAFIALNVIRSKAGATAEVAAMVSIGFGVWLTLLAGLAVVAGGILYARNAPTA